MITAQKARNKRLGRVAKVKPVNFAALAAGDDTSFAPLVPILERIAGEHRVNPLLLQRPGREDRLVRARDHFCHEAYNVAGHRAEFVASFLGCDPSGVRRGEVRHRKNLKMIGGVND